MCLIDFELREKLPWKGLLIKRIKGGENNSFVWNNFNHAKYAILY